MGDQIGESYTLVSPTCFFYCWLGNFHGCCSRGGFPSSFSSLAFEYPRFMHLSPENPCPISQLQWLHLPEDKFSSPHWSHYLEKQCSYAQPLHFSISTCSNHGYTATTAVASTSSSSSSLSSSMYIPSISLSSSFDS